MKHLQMDIFKEITFERLITEYSIVKREACGALDDEIVDIDWCIVMNGFGIVLKARMGTCSRTILLRIHNAIDSNANITSKQAAKDLYTDSMNSFLRHGVRTINSVINKTVHKIGTHFDSLNFSDNLPKHNTFVGKNKGYAFAFSASMYDIFDSNASAGPLVGNGGEYGIDPLLREIMKSGPKEEHMKSIIEYSLIKKSVYLNCPANYGALHQYLTARNTVVPVAIGATTTTTPTTPITIADVEAVITTISHNETSSPLNRSDVVAEVGIADNNDQLLLLSVAELLSNSTPASNHNKQLFPSTDDDHLSSTPVMHNRDSPIIVIDGADLLTPAVDTTRSLVDNVTKCYKQFMELFLSDVHGFDEHLAMKFNIKHNVRNSSNLAILKFLHDHRDLKESEFYDLFCTSPFFKTMSCGMFIPLLLEDQYNIRGDGYCFYRAIFMLLMREKSGFVLTVEELCHMDQLLNAVGESSADSLRAEFLAFFQHLEELFPDQHAKCKAATAGCTFANLGGTYLSEKFWGGSDSVPFLDFPCTAFAYSRDEKSFLKGCWAKMFCSSIPGLVNGRDTLDFATVGNAYSLYDVLVVLMRPHNWLLHKQVHFFIADHPSVETFLDSFSVCLRKMLNELRSRLLVVSNIENPMFNFTQVFDRILNGTCIDSDVSSLTQSFDTLTTHLAKGNFVFGACDEESTSKSLEPKKECFLQTPFGATQAQKIYISTINNTVTVEN
jgi:hypothetical protein